MQAGRRLRVGRSELGRGYAESALEPTAEVRHALESDTVGDLAHGSVGRPKEFCSSFEADGEDDFRRRVLNETLQATIETGTAISEREGQGFHVERLVVEVGLDRPADVVEELLFGGGGRRIVGESGREAVGSSACCGGAPGSRCRRTRGLTITGLRVVFRRSAARRIGVSGFFTS